MIQAFVSLKLQQPPRTESGLRSFFEALQGAVFSQPTVFRTNADAMVRPYSLDAIVEATLNPRCKFVVLRAQKEKFWQCTFLLPDKQGMGALFFDLQNAKNPRTLSPESLIEMFKKLYHSLSPRLIRIGDSEAREKLKSKHGLVQMPGIGRVEWLQIVSPELYGDIYNPSELVAAPCFQTEILDDGALFMRVYEDPNDWDSEDNISQANFIPGFLAGIVKIKDSEKEKENLRDLERIWSRAEKTAENAYEALDGKPGESEAAPVASTPKAEPVVEAPKPEPVVETPAAPVVTAENGDDRMRTVVYNRLKADFKVEENNIVKVGVEGPCTLFKVKAGKKPEFYATYQDLDLRVFILNSLEDLARFISTNGCKVDESCTAKIRTLLDKYYHPEYTILDSLDALPEDVRRDRRVKDLKAQFKATGIEDLGGGTKRLTFWFFRPDITGVETLSMTQFEDMPMQLETKIQCTEMENEPEPVVVPEPAKPVAKAAAPEPVKVAEKPVEKVAETPIENVVAKQVAKAEPKPRTEPMPAKVVDEAKSDSSVGKIIIAIVVLIVLAYVAAAFLMYDGDMLFIKQFLQ